jgi:hypothetical protein
MDGRFYGYGIGSLRMSTDTGSVFVGICSSEEWFEDRSSTDMLVCQAMDSFWLEDFHKRSCWKNSIGVSVPRPCGSDVYVCSKSCWLCLTVAY